MPAPRAGGGPVPGMPASVKAEEGKTMQPWGGRGLRRALAALLGLLGVVGLKAAPTVRGTVTETIRAWDQRVLSPLTVGAPVPVDSRRTRPRQDGPARIAPLGHGLALGYLYDPGASSAEAVAELKPYLPFLTGIMPDWYSIDAQGELGGSTDTGVMRFALRHHLLTFAVVAEMNPGTAQALLASPVARRRAVAQMLTMVEADGFDGVNLDWEGLYPSDRRAFTTFVDSLAAAFHRQGYYVTLSLPAETRATASPGDSWTGAYDYRALGRAADLMMVMAYDEHWQGGPPGPIAGKAWVRSVLTYTISQVSPAKVILGIPGYGYDWSGEGAIALTFEQAQALEHEYDPSTATNHFQYVQNGTLHSVWFENTASLLSKVSLVSGFELRGIALWRLGIEDPKIWDFLQ